MHISIPSRDSYYVSVETTDVKASDKILECIKGFDSHYKILSQNMSGGKLKVTAEVHTLKPGDILSSLNELENVNSVNVIAHGDNTGI